jgi:aspartyl-tRNA(Asn)/glutamyl-tRNA(Gln) amidotransferase subunit A
MLESAVRLAEKLRNKEVSSREVVDDLLPRLEEKNEEIQAYVTVRAEEARERASEIDARRAKGEELGPWAGLPIALKDLLCTKGIRTTCSSKMLENFVPPYDATVVRKLDDAGFVVVGKTNMD